MGGGGGWCGWEEVALRVGEFNVIIVNSVVVGGEVGGTGVGCDGEVGGGGKLIKSKYLETHLGNPRS